MAQTHDDPRRIANELRGQPSILSLSDVRQPGDIERVEEADGGVRYSNVLLIAPGVWTDAGSEQRVWYSPDGIRNSADQWEDNTLNLLHAQEDEVMEVGEVDTESVYVDGTGNMYGDIVLHMETAGSEFADDVLREGLSSDGTRGVQGPSVELRGEEYRWNADHEAHELVRGAFQGVGLVGLGLTAGPASKPADFARQTRDRAVALADADSDDDLAVYTREHEMTIDTETVREQLSAEGVDLDDVEDDTLESALSDALTTTEEPNDDNPPDDPDGAELQDDDEEDEEESEGGDDNPDDEHEDEDDADMSELTERLNQNFQQIDERMSALEQRLESLEDETEQLRTSDTPLSSIDDLAEQVEQLAEAETVDELESRLSAIEDEPKQPKSLAAGAVDDAPDEDDGVAISEFGGAVPGRPRVTKNP